MSEETMTSAEWFDRFETLRAETDRIAIAIKVASDALDAAYAARDKANKRFSDHMDALMTGRVVRP